MKPWKRFLKSDGLRVVLCWLGAQYIRFVHATGRWTRVGEEIPQRLWDEKRPFILAFWHGRLLMMPHSWDLSAMPIRVLITHHRDGQILARTVGHLGIETIFGSSSKGGAAALKAIVSALKNGQCVCMTPDGPRGPRMRASDGVVAMARLAGAPVVPVAFSVSRGRHLGSWDRFLLAWPFARGVYVWGEPIEVSRDADPDAMRQTIEDAITQATNEADRLCGRPAVEPDPAPEAAGA